MRKVLKTLLLILWLLLIYFFSSQNGIASAGLSTKVLTFIGNLINGIVKIDVASFVKTFGLLIRKIAHFSEFFILFIIAKECFKEYGNKKIVIVIVFCVACAFLDEFHQLFIDGRSGQLLDVLIDSSGVLCSYLFWHRLLKK